MKRIAYLDFLRVLGSIAVVVIHVSAPLVVRYETINSPGWWLANLLDSFSRWAVPIFVMISGTILIPKVASFSSPQQWSYIWSRVKKLGGITFFWVMFYAWFYDFWHLTPFSPLKIVYHIIFKQQYHHLYFFFLILELTIITPFLATLWKQLDKTGRSIVFGGLSLITIFWVPDSVLWSFFMPYLAYYWGGALLHTYPPQLKFLSAPNLRIMQLCCFILSSLTVAISVRLSQSLALYEYSSLPVVIASWALFAAARPHKATFWAKISQTTLGIYVVHPAVIILLDRVFSLNVSRFGSAGIGMLVLGTVTLVSSWVITMLLLKAPGLNLTVKSSG